MTRLHTIATLILIAAALLHWPQPVAVEMLPDVVEWRV